MKIEPITTEYKVEYPNEKEFGRNSFLLRTKKPKRWLKNLAITGILSGIVFGSLTGFSSHSPQKANKNRVAPLFEHGNGVGSFGGIRASFPEFINESEAKNIIMASFKKENIALDESKAFDTLFKIKKVELKETYNKHDNVSYSKRIIKNNLKFILINKEHKLGIVYVNRSNIHLYADDEKVISTLSSEKYKETALKIINTIKKIKKIDLNVAVFYDPTDPKIEKSKEQLKAQINDFIKWNK